MEDSIEDMSFSDNEAVCVDDEVFFGPMTEKEKKIKRRFERMMEKEGRYMPPPWNETSDRDNKQLVDAGMTVDSSESSVYESFTNEESKYDSFNDSLNEGLPEEINASQFLLEQVNVNCLRSQTKKKVPSTGYYCDSLEDINSLVSSMDRFSVSEEIEGINILEQSTKCDDSLRNGVCVKNGNSSNEQCFDDDSLAILEYEKNFDDSLDESNLPSLNHTDSLIISRNKDDNDHSLAAKLSFNVIYENMANSSDESDKLFGKDVADINTQSMSDEVSQDSLEEMQEVSNLSSAKNLSGDSGMKYKDDFRIIPNRKKGVAYMDEFEDSIQSLPPLKNCPRLSTKQDDASIDDSVMILNISNTNVSVSAMNTKDKLFLGPIHSVCPNTVAEPSVSELDAILPESHIIPATNDTILIEDSIIDCPDAAFSTNLTAKSIKMEIVFPVNTLPGQNHNNTIWIDDSIIQSTDAAFCAENNSDDDSSKFETAQSSYHTIYIDDSILQSPPNLAPISKSPTKSLNTFNPNGTILIDESVILSPKDSMPIKAEAKDVELNDSFEARIKKVSLNGRYKGLGSYSSSDAISCSNENDSSSAGAQSPIDKMLKKGLTYDLSATKYDLISPFATPENKLKIQVEVEIEGLNIISVSSIKKDGHEQSLTPNFKADPRRNLNFDSETKNQTETSACNNFTEQNDEVKKMSNGKTALHRFPRKEKFESNKFSEDFHIKLGMHNAELLQALDLHDTSYNFIDEGNVQSRDSIMPLNLCTRDKSLKNKSTLLRNESKENIPFYSAHSKELKPDIPKCNVKALTGSPLMNTNKISNQFNTDPEVKNSGGRANSATKIPIRRMENAFLHPFSNQKTLKQSGVRQNKTVKTPASAIPKDVCEETPKKHNHHFCMIRNSISKVPKSVQKFTSKKFRNIQSPIAQYIGNAACVPSKNIDCPDEYNLVTNMGPPSEIPSNGQQLTPTQKTKKK